MGWTYTTYECIAEKNKPFSAPKEIAPTGASDKVNQIHLFCHVTIIQWQIPLVQDQMTSVNISGFFMYSQMKNYIVWRTQEV